MYASEITRHCGIHRWVSNSIVVHATSEGPADGWHFQRRGEVSGLFSHEPIVARAPTGEVVVYLTSYPGDGSDCPVCNCTDSTSASGGASCAGECGGGKNKTLFSCEGLRATPCDLDANPVLVVPTRPANLPQQSSFFSHSCAVQRLAHLSLRDCV